MEKLLKEKFLRHMDADGGIVVWIVNLEDLSVDSHEIDRVLSSVEKARYDQMMDKTGKERFLRRRVLLRWLLSQYLSIPPKSVEIGEGHNGKPVLMGAQNYFFNVSESLGIAAFAFHPFVELGVDIEKIRDFSGIDRISNRFFSVEEREIVNQYTGDLKAKAFFRVWTQKEAFVKLTGEGAFKVGSIEVNPIFEQEPEIKKYNSKITTQVQLETHFQQDYVTSTCYPGPKQKIKYIH